MTIWRYASSLNSNNFHFGVSGSFSWLTPEVRNRAPSASLSGYLVLKPWRGCSRCPAAAVVLDEIHNQHVAGLRLQKPPKSMFHSSTCSTWLCVLAFPFTLLNCVVTGKQFGNNPKLKRGLLHKLTHIYVPTKSGGSHRHKSLLEYLGAI